MSIMTKILAGGAGLAALAVAAPAAAQYSYGYGYGNPYAYGSQYGQVRQYGYGYQNPYMASATQMAIQRCNAAVQYRLQNRTSAGGILGAILGVNTATQGRVLGVTRVTPRRSTVTVRGVANSGRYAYSPWGMGAYGAVGYAHQPDLRFTCRVDYRGYVRDIDFDRIR